MAKPTSTGRAAKKAPAKKIAAKKATAKKVAAKKAPAEKVAAKKAPVKKAPGLQATLASLESAIEKRYPRKRKGLAPPAAESSLDALRDGVGFDLPADVITLYRWHGSADGLLVDENTDSSSEGWTLSAPEGVLADHRIWSEVAPKGWSAAWLPLFTNHGGDNVCLDTRDGKLVGLFHEDPEDHPIVATSLDAAFAYVLARVKAGTWRGVPESDPVPRIIAKLRKSPNDALSIFGNDVFGLLSVDPPAVLELIAEVEPLGIVPATTLRSYEARAHLERKDADSAHRSYVAYLHAVRAAGSTYNPPFRALRAGFEKLGKQALAAELAELDALASEYLLDAWIRTSAPKADARADALRSFVAKADERLQTAEGAKAARAASLKAAALQQLGDATAAESAWQLAATSDAGVAAIWKTHSLLV